MSSPMPQISVFQMRSSGCAVTPAISQVAGHRLVAYDLDIRFGFFSVRELRNDYETDGIGAGSRCE